MTKRHYFIPFGPPIPVVPTSHFTKTRLTQKQMADLWKLCGPSVEFNLRRLELWQVIAMAYLEGLHHGSALIREQTARKETPNVPEDSHECVTWSVDY